MHAADRSGANTLKQARGDRGGGHLNSSRDLLDCNISLSPLRELIELRKRLPHMKGRQLMPQAGSMYVDSDPKRPKSLSF